MVFGWWLVSIKISAEKSDRSLNKKACQNNTFMWDLYHQLKTNSVGLHRLMSSGKDGEAFLLKGMRNPFLELGCQACVSMRPRDHLPTFEKTSCVQVLSPTKPSALSVGVKDSVPFDKWVDMSWQVSLTPFAFSCNVLGLCVSYCHVCKGCFACL